MQTVSIDRFEGGKAVCETDARKHILIPLDQLPAGAKEGDCLDIDGGVIVINHEETDRRRQKALELQRRLFGGG
ncbi:DUF3006 domain-containing protein [Candidatus Soleaferrea massiliensis]|uniref:DUF3006 domain-containing protein n=1 Tax=Candidatus Soleaferrea massiliensis TaxID=1470354 RepID=UPI00058E74CA|nr:DUF3006 domain-containing protein [Candidatus Soleaferrea massiliensis]